MSDLSSTTRALLRSARADGPSAVARHEIWGGITGVTGALAAGASAPGAGSGGAASGGASLSGGVAAGKLIALGALLGGAVTVGITALVLGIGRPEVGAPEAAPRAGPVAAETVALGSRAHGEGFSAPHVIRSVAPQTLQTLQTPPPTSADRASPSALAPADDHLTREAKLVAEARGALRRGDADRALTAARAARSVPRAQLEPESLSIEIGALRALGRDDDAMAAELEMRRKYPDHALSR